METQAMTDFSRENIRARFNELVTRCGGIAELSRRTGYPYRTVQKWKLGVRIPRTDRILEVFANCEKAAKEGMSNGAK